MKYEEILRSIQQEGIFTSTETYEDFVSHLCERFARVHSEILPKNNYEVIVKKLEEKGYL